MAIDQLDKALSALSHASRRAIVRRLSREGPARVTEIAGEFDTSLNAVSKHLKVLEGAGLVRRTRVGREHLIEFDPKPLHAISDWVHFYEKFWFGKLDKLEGHFRDKKKEGKDAK